MRTGRRPTHDASDRIASVSRDGRHWLVMVLVAIVTLAACSSDGDQTATTAGGDGSEVAGTETTSDEGAGDDAPDDAGGAAVEGAFAFALDSRAGEVWGINPDTQTIGLLTTVDRDSQRIWAISDGLWVATPEALIHVGISGEQLGTVELEKVYDLAADGDEVWVAGGTASDDTRAPYLSKIDATSHSEVASIESQALTGEFGLFEDIAVGDEVLWLAYTLASDRATGIDRMDRDSLEVVGTTAVPIEARSLIWSGSSLWAAGWMADSSDFGVVQIAPDGTLVSEAAIADFERSRGWDFAVTDDGVWVGNLTTSELIRLDPDSSTETDRIQLAELGTLEGVHVSDGRLWASVNQGDSSFIELGLFVIDRETNEPTPVMDLPERLRATFLSDG